jgi:hypothetical protein
MSYPNINETPLSFSDQPSISSGSAHKRSHNIPESGTSNGLYMTELI